METTFLVCAVLGGTVLICQFVMIVMGLSGDHGFDGGGDHDVFHHVGGHDAQGDSHANDHHGSTWLFGVITFRTVVAALTFFGLAGMAGLKSDFQQGTTLVVAAAAGVAAMFGVHWLMQALHKLKSDGTERIDRAVGRQGTVYLPIPAGKAGAGKVHITLQNRMVEYQAMTSADKKLPGGATIVVTGVLGPDMVEVEPAT